MSNVPNRLQIDCISKSYATPVLHRVSLNVAPGEIHALIGANGAGKSTLSRIIAGLVPASSGAMMLDGAEYAPRHKSDAEQAGVQIVQQELNLIGTLSVAENLFFNRLPSRFGFIDRKRLRELATVALDKVGLSEIDPSDLTESLGVGVRQLIEIASALSRDCRLLILDEPTAALTNHETERLFKSLREMRSRGISMIYISHRLDEISSLCDRLTVLRDGEVICTAPVSSSSAEQIVAHMTRGAKKTSTERNLPEGESRTPANSSSVRANVANDYCFENGIALRVSHLSSGPLVQDVSFEVRRGQRLGITGLVGSGRSELLRAIFGADFGARGKLAVMAEEEHNPFSHPRQAVLSGLGLVTEERKHDGLLLSQTVKTNLSLASLGQFANFGFVSASRELAKTDEIVSCVAAKCQSVDQRVDELSGGNQQKIVLGKWLLRDTCVLLLDEPTRGIDIESRRRIHQLIQKHVALGNAAVMVSSDLDELLDHCDAIAVMSAGRMVAHFGRHEFSVSAIMAASFSHIANRA